MERLKQFLAFPMYASAAWLIWVLAQQSGANAVGFVLLAMVSLALAAWAWTTSTQAGAAGRLLGRSVAVLAMLGVLTSLGAASTSPGEPLTGPAGSIAQAEGAVEPYDPERISALQAEGQAEEQVTGVGGEDGHDVEPELSKWTVVRISFGPDILHRRFFG